MSEPEYLTEDPLFLALTRPTLWFGVPVEATLLIGMASVFVLMVVGNPIWALAIGGALLGAARLIVRTDYNMFKIIFLFGRTNVIFNSQRQMRHLPKPRAAVTIECIVLQCCR